MADDDAVKLRALLPISALVLAPVAMAPGLQAANATGIYGAWTFSSSTAGALNMGGVLPNASVSIVGGSGSAATGNTIYLNQNTPVGLEYGSSSNKSYASIGLGSSFTVPGTPSVTTVRFAVATPSSGWSFALGDIDAEDIRIAATGPAGPLDVSGWFRSAFNYCSTPKPSGCPSGTPTDAPRWVAPVLEGNKVDTGGAAAWFTPTAAVIELTFTQIRNVAGGPSFQLWVMSDTSVAPEEPQVVEEPEKETTEESAEETVEESAESEQTDTANESTESGEPTVTSPSDAKPLVVKPGESVVIPVLEIAGAPEGSTITEVAKPANGTVRINGEAVIYTPAAGFYGNDTVTATVADRAGTATTVSVPVQVGLVQRPVRPPKLAKQVKRGVTTVVLGGPVRTNARQFARADITCAVKSRVAYLGGGEPICVVTRSRGQVSVRVTGYGPVTVRVELGAPPKGSYGPYALVKRYLVP
jgi:hypothetical protein